MSSNLNWSRQSGLILFYWNKTQNIFRNPKICILRKKHTQCFFNIDLKMYQFAKNRQIILKQLCDLLCWRRDASQFVDTLQEFMSEAKNEVRPRAVLSKEQAIEIFEYKKKLGNHSLTATSIELANKYNVNSKTIRDIWSGRSWFEATYPQWQQVCPLNSYDTYLDTCIYRINGLVDCKKFIFLGRLRIVPVNLIFFCQATEIGRQTLSHQR